MDGSHSTNNHFYTLIMSFKLKLLLNYREVSISSFSVSYTLFAILKI